MRQFLESNMVIFDFITYIASGFDNPYKLRHDPRLEPLSKPRRFPEAGLGAGSELHRRA